MALYFGSNRISDVTVPMASLTPTTIIAGDTPVILKQGLFRSVSNRAYEEMTDSAITIPRAGTYRIKFSCVNLHSTIFDSVAYAQIWVNHAAREDGVTFNVTKRADTDVFVYSEDISLSYGDVVTIALQSADTSYSVSCMSVAACIYWDNGF